MGSQSGPPDGAKCVAGQGKGASSIRKARERDLRRIHSDRRLNLSGLFPAQWPQSPAPPTPALFLRGPTRIPCFGRKRAYSNRYISGKYQASCQHLTGYLPHARLAAVATRPRRMAEIRHPIHAATKLSTIMKPSSNYLVSSNLQYRNRIACPVTSRYPDPIKFQDSCWQLSRRMQE